MLERVPMLRRLGGPALRMLAIGGGKPRRRRRRTAVRRGRYRRWRLHRAAGFVRAAAGAGRPERGHRRAGHPDRRIGAALRDAAAGHRHRARAFDRACACRAAMFLKMLEGYPDAARRLREIIAVARRPVDARSGKRARRARSRHQAAAPIVAPARMPHAKPPASPSPARGRRARPAARILENRDPPTSGRRAPARPRCDRAGGRYRQGSSPASDSSTR